jgi:hypothetical protein
MDGEPVMAASGGRSPWQTASCTAASSASGTAQGPSSRMMDRSVSRVPSMEAVNGRVVIRFVQQWPIRDPLTCGLRLTGPGGVCRRSDSRSPLAWAPCTCGYFTNLHNHFGAGCGDPLRRLAHPSTAIRHVAVATRRASGGSEGGNINKAGELATATAADRHAESFGQTGASPPDDATDRLCGLT